MTTNEIMNSFTGVSFNFFCKTMRQKWYWPLFNSRYYLREYIAEFFGMMVFMSFGIGVVATTHFQGGAFNQMQSNASYLAITTGWGFGLCVGLYVSMGVSGGHLNPAVTLANCVFGTFPWRKAPGYMLSQLLGAMVAAACVYGLFVDHFNKVQLKPGETLTSLTGYIFCTYPKVTNKSAIWSEFYNSVLLLMGIMGVADERMTPAVNHRPIGLGILISMIGLCTGWNTGYAINPARDLGPRLVSAMVFRSSEPFTLHSHYFWIPIVVPIFGAIVGLFLYNVFIIPTEWKQPDVGILANVQTMNEENVPH